MNQVVTTLTPGGHALGQTLGFEAAAVICDNYTSSYLQLVDAGKTIPPWTVSAVVALPPGIRQANAKLVPTTPAIPGPPVPLSQATLTWSDAALPANPGHLLQQASFGQATLIDSALGVTPGGGSVTHTGIAVPAGTQTLLLIGTDQTFNSGAGHVDLSGEVTNQTYSGSEPFPTSPSTVPIGGVLYFAAIPEDTTVRAVYDAVAAVRVNFWLFALPTVPAVSVINQVKATLMDSLGFLLSTPTEVGVDPLLGVTLSGANPAPWQAPDQIVFATRAGIGAVTLIAGVAGKTVRLFGGVFDVPTAVAGSGSTLQDSTGVVLAAWDTTAVIRGQPLDFSGAPIVTGRGLQLTVAGAAATARMGLAVSQA